MSGWAACIAVGERCELAGLRLFPGTECAEVGGMMWLRGTSASEELERALAKVPGLERFEWLASGRLKSPQSRIPGGVLPPATWRPLKEALVPALPSAALSGETRQKLSLGLVRGGEEREASGLVTSLAEWGRFASAAPMARLERLVFAVAEDGQTLVLGEPLPTLSGMRLVNRSGVLTPCGFEWRPAVGAAVLRELFGLAGNDVVVLAEDGTHQVVKGEQFVRASRSAVRATMAEFGKGGEDAS